MSSVIVGSPSKRAKRRNSRSVIARNVFFIAAFRHDLNVQRVARAANGLSCALTVEWMMMDAIEENEDVVLYHNPSLSRYSGNQVGQSVSNLMDVNPNQTCSQLQAVAGAYETLILDVPTDGTKLPAYYKWLILLEIISSSIIVLGDVTNQLFCVRT